MTLTGGGVLAIDPRDARVVVPEESEMTTSSIHVVFWSLGRGLNPRPCGARKTCLSAYEADALRCRETSTRLSHRGTKPTLDNALT